ncbi:MAG: redoxin domain-containing protein [Bacteroidaceae bacterium]|nr:redoxin domain-containing protein [Bacteroidaceae bacterium]
MNKEVIICSGRTTSRLCKRRVFLTIMLLALVALAGQARKKVKVPEVPQLLNYPCAELGEYRLHGGEVVIKGRLTLPKEWNGEEIPEDAYKEIPAEVFEMIQSQMKIYLRDYVIHKEKILPFDFKDDLTFSMNLRLPHPMFVWFYPMRMLFACPGDTLDLTIDITNPKDVTIDGTGLSVEVSRLADGMHRKYCTFPQERPYEHGADSLLRWKDEQVERLDSLVRQMNAGLPELEGCSPLATDVLRTYILCPHLENICSSFMRFKYESTDSMDMNAYWQKYFSFVAPREKYLLDNPLLMIAGDEFFFNRLEFHLFRPLRASVEYSLPFDYVPKYAEALAKREIHWRREARREQMEALHTGLHISQTNFAAQVCLLREVFSRGAGGGYDLFADEVAATMPVITHPELIRRAVLTYRDFVKEHELKVVEERPTTKGDSIFQRIIEPYRGNVLFVDFWEMSCGPCRATMLQMRDEVEANKDKPVKYLYITDDKEEYCRTFLEPNNIQGEHIFVSRTEWGFLQDKFQFTGIPFTVLYDKDGKRRDGTTVEKLLEE